MTSQPAGDKSQCYQIAGCFFDLIGRVLNQGEKLAAEQSIPAPVIKVLHILDGPLAMKDLGRKMHCDPSFVTLVADMLEKRGLARRQPHPADRRVKNLVLTDDGLALKHTIESELTTRMPWATALDPEERAQLLALIRKMLSADADGGTATGTVPSDAVPGELTSMLVTALHDSAPPGRAGQHTSPAGAGEVTRAAGDAQAAG